MKAYKLDLSPADKQRLKHNNIKISELKDYAVDEIAHILNINTERASQINALIEFQSIPSVGPKFAQDLVDGGYLSIDELRDKNGAQLLDAYEQQIGVWADPCVEDQFRLVVHHANNPGSKKQWWDFTAERKAYRKQYGYPANRPVTAWYTLPQYQKQTEPTTTSYEAIF